MRIPEIYSKAVTPPNIAINGNMEFWQRIVGNSLAFSTATATSWSADRYSHHTAGATAKSFTVQRSTLVPAVSLIGIQPKYSCQVTCNTSYSPAASDRWMAFRTVVEGNDLREIFQSGFVTFVFEFFATQSGNYPCRIYNFATNRSYVTTFTYDAANVWQQIKVTFPIENTTWNFGSTPSLGFYIQHDGSSFQTAPNAWAAGDFGTSNAGGFVSLCQSGLVFRITNFAIYAGDVSVDRKLFKTRGGGYDEELRLCQRYYEKNYAIETPPGTNLTAGLNGISGLRVAAAPAGTLSQSIEFRAEKRATPAMTPYDATGNINRLRVNAIENSTNGGLDWISTTGFSIRGNSCTEVLGYWTADAEM